MSFAHSTFCVLVFYLYIFGIAATWHPCTTCLHIPLLYIPAYLNIEVYSILSCTFFILYILFFISYFLLISFYVYFLCVVFYNICTVHGADLTHISLLLYTLYIIVYVTNKNLESWINNFYCIVQKYNFGETKLFGYQCYKPDISFNYFADLSHIPLENWQKTKNYILHK